MKVTIKEGMLVCVGCSRVLVAVWEADILNILSGLAGVKRKARKPQTAGPYTLGRFYHCRGGQPSFYFKICLFPSLRRCRFLHGLCATTYTLIQTHSGNQRETGSPVINLRGCCFNTPLPLNTRNNKKCITADSLSGRSGLFGLHSDPPLPGIVKVLYWPTAEVDPTPSDPPKRVG